MAEDNNANSRMNNYFERLAIWACGCIIALLCIGYQEQKTTIDKMEERVQFLMLDKVGKGELKEVESRIMSRIEAGNADILARIDLLIKANSK